MFELRHIWKISPKRSLWAVVFALALSLVSQPALALGERYSWQGTGDTTFVGTDGNFGAGKEVTFTKSGEANGGTTFTGSGTYTCNGQSKTGQLTITIDPVNYQKHYPTAGTVTGADASCFLAVEIDQSTTVTDPNQPAAGGANAPPTCDQGSLSWIMCPVIENVSNVISKLATEILQPFLEVKPITPESTPALYNAWSHMRDLAQVLFILVFFVIIAANMLQQDIGGFDQYTVKKALPRLVIASILVQFSFMISGIIIDIGNVLGGGVGTLLIAITDPANGTPSLANLIGNLVTGGVAVVVGAGAVAVLASWTVAAPILVSLLLSLLVVFLTLGARYLLIAVMVVVSPLALLAWVLPNTEKYFRQWIDFLFKLVLMYPIVMGIIAVAGLINQILPFSSDAAPNAVAGAAAALIKPVILIAAFFIIPASFKWAGAGLHRIHGLLSNGADRGRAALKGSDMWERGLQKRQERKNMFMDRVMKSDTVNSLQRKGAGGRAAASMMTSGAALAFMRAPGNKPALDRSNSALINKNAKQLEDLKEAQNPQNLKYALAAATGDSAARAKLQHSAPELLSYANTAQGREAMFKKLVSTEFADSKDLEQYRTAQPKRGLAYFGANGDLRTEYTSLRDTGQAKRNQLPTIVQRLPEAKTYDLTDRAGNVLTTVSRPSGAIDMNGVAKSFAKYTANDIAKLSPDVFEMMNDTINPVASAHQRQAAEDAARAMAVGVEPRQLAKVFDPNDRNPAPPERKIAIARAMRSNYDKVWKTSSEYRTTFEAVHDQVIKDDKLLIQLARSAGATQHDLSLLNPDGIAYVGSQWMKDKSFDYQKVGLSPTDINVAGRKLRGK